MSTFNIELFNLIILIFVLISHFDNCFCESVTEKCIKLEPSGPLVPDSNLNAALSKAELCFATQKNCDPNNIFYTADGSCNNLEKTHWGRSVLPFARFVEPNYQDGYYKIKMALRDGSRLPPARRIRTILFPNNESILARNISTNIFFIGFGQLMAVDVGSQSPVQDPSIASCCKIENSTPKFDDICLPLSIPTDDYFYSKKNVSCLEHRRSNHTKLVNCDVKPIHQINHQTPFLDLSVTYGKHDESAQRLRSSDGGLLKASNNEATNNQLLPPITSGPRDCPAGGIERQRGAKCFDAGDPRVNLNPEILTAETVFLRLHNWVVMELRKLNPQLKDNEQLYQIARKIVIAKYQHVIMKEYVPIILGPHISKLYKLYPLEDGYAEGYDSTLNPQTLDIFSAAAGRSLHSSIVGAVKYGFPRARTEPKTYSLRDVYFKQSFLLEKNNFLSIIDAFVSQSCQDHDQYFSQDVSDMFYLPIAAPHTADLPSIDMVRARDFGIAGYNRIREACGLCQIKNFEDLAPIIKNADINIKKLKSLYKSMDNAEYYPLALLEKPVKDGLLGPSLACILAQSFFTWKHADRLFYEFPTSKFTADQLKSLRSSSISEIICLTNPELRSIPRNGFLSPSPLNPAVACASIPKMNLTPWKLTSTNST